MRLFLGILGLIALANCAGTVNAPAADIAAARYQSSEPAYVSLMTMVNIENDEGAHSAIIANGSQVALYDPAGTYEHPTTPEVNDVFYGMTPRMIEVYEFFHARKTHYVVEQRVPVTREMADAVIARMEAQGPSGKMFCGINTSEVLRDFPMFAHMPRSFYPDKLMAAMDKVPGVTTRRVYESDTGKNISFAPRKERNF